MKRFFLIATLLITNKVMAEETERTFSFKSTEVAEYYCNQSNVIALQPCVEEFNRCLLGASAERILLPDVDRVFNAIRFCNGSLTEI